MNVVTDTEEDESFVDAEEARGTSEGRGPGSARRRVRVANRRDETWRAGAREDIEAAARCVAVMTQR